MPLKFFFFCFAFLQFKGSKVCNVENVIELGLVLYTLENAKLRPVSRNHGILCLSLKIREISAYFPCQTYKKWPQSEYNQGQATFRISCRFRKTKLF